MRTQLNATVTSETETNLPDGRLLIVSNRGPVEYTANGAGLLEERRAGGGLATALTCVANSRQVTWIASAGPAPGRNGSNGGSAGLGNNRRLRLVAAPREAYDLYYGTFCNPLLWYLQHSLWRKLERPDAAAEALHAWERGYLPVNEAFGKAVAEELAESRGPSQVMLHDYHLYVAPRIIRDRVPEAALQHFVHIPWPGPEEWESLPRSIVEGICRGLLANDSVVFQTEESVTNFRLTCEAFLPDAHATNGGTVIRRNGHETCVWANPISVDVSDLRYRLSQPKADDYRRKLAPTADQRTIVRVDRLDPSKNILAGFRAFDVLLERHPEWAGRTRFLAFLVPSRRGIPEYRHYTKKALALVDDINGRYGTPDWTPVTVFHEHNRLQALVAMSLYDVMLVNPLQDGMNLVSKEGPVVNERDGVLVLSTAAGSYAELREGALPVQADDVGGTAEALHRALSMPAEEREERAGHLRQVVEGHDLDDWLRRQLDDLASIGYGSTAKGPVLVRS